MDRSTSNVFSGARKLPDSLGILSAGLCLLHCLGGPLLLAFGMEFLTEEWLKYPFLLLSLVAVYFAVRRCSHGLGVVMWGSFAVLFFATLFMEEYDWLHYLAYIASFTMIGCHILNLIQHTSTKHHD